MKTLLTSLMLLVTALWAYGVANEPVLAQVHPAWLARQEFLHWSGLIAIALMSLAMVLAARPAWLERPLGGLDRMVQGHRWAGIGGVGFAALHWLIEMSDDVLKLAIGRAGRLPRASLPSFWEGLRDAAKDMGEWAIYALLAMLVISLWRRFPYRAWHWLHRVMPVLYLTLAFHAAVLAPRGYWGSPLGALLLILLAGGSVGAVLSLLGRIGRSRQVGGTISLIERHDGVTRIECLLDSAWSGHQPGQFVLLTLDPHEGAHPFTIASADLGDCKLSFAIKALGDFTASLADHVQVGQRVQVEGPYGRFALARCKPRRRQVWIAGGVGVTPFLAWLQALARGERPEISADLHYCTRDRRTDPFVAQLLDLCARTARVRLHIHDTQAGERLQAQALGDLRRAELWFCGPGGLAQSLRQGFATLGLRTSLHQEAFQWR